MADIFPTQPHMMFSMLANPQKMVVRSLVKPFDQSTEKDRPILD